MYYNYTEKAKESMKKIIVAPDSFKGSLSAARACEVIASAVEKAGNFEIIKIPVADGGEGTLSIAASLDGSRVKTAEVCGPLGKTVKAEYVINKKTAIIESAQACGLTLLCETEKKPLFTTTYGVGQLVLSALEEDIDTIMITLGGSSTNDCGIGFLSALGVEFSGINNAVPPSGKDLCGITDINTDKLDSRLKKVRIYALCDVENPLYGKNGAAYVFARQKGADEKTVELLDSGLERFAATVKRKTGRDIAFINGAGAAGGLGAALILLGAKIVKGAEAVISAVGFDEKLKNADYVFTGEGRFDRQSFMGKATGTVYVRASKEKIPVAVFCGGYDNVGNTEGLKTVCITPEGQSTDEAMRNAEQNLFAAVTRFIEKYL